MINIRKEQKITIPLTYLEYLEPNFVFIPIKEKTSFPKVAVTKDNYIEDIKIPINGDIIATAVNNNDNYLIIKNTNNKNQKNNEKQDVEKKNNLEEKGVISFLSINETNDITNNKTNDKFSNNFKDKKILYVNAFDKDPSCFNNYYLLDKEEDKLLEAFTFLIDNYGIEEIKIVIPASYEAMIKKYQKLENKKIKLTIINDYFSLGYKDILSKYLRVNSRDIVNLKEVLNLYYELRNIDNNYLYITISGNVKFLVLKVLKYTILKEVLEFLNISPDEVDISLNNSLINQKIDYKYVLNAETELIIINKKEILESNDKREILRQKKNFNKRGEYNCSNCGLCYMMCPWHLNPLKVEKCSKCGLCNYPCPNKKILITGGYNE